VALPLILGKRVIDPIDFTFVVSNMKRLVVKDLLLVRALEVVPKQALAAS
jgi:hypothetical protein